jgi:hypothetical protein
LSLPTFPTSIGFLGKCQALSKRLTKEIKETTKTSIRPPINTRQSVTASSSIYFITCRPDLMYLGGIIWHLAPGVFNFDHQIKIEGIPDEIELGKAF